MKKIILLAILGALSMKSFAQAALVMDVERNLYLQSLLDQRAVTMFSEKLMQSKLAEMELLDKLRMSGEFVQTLQSLRILHGVVQELACQIDGLYVSMGHYRFHEDCLFKMKMEVAFLKLELTTEALEMVNASKSIFSKKFSASDRIGMMNKTSQTIMDTSKMLEELKTLINRQNTFYLNSVCSKLKTKNNPTNLNRYRP